MIKDFKLIVGTENLSMYENSKNIIGDIYFKLEDIYFPQYKWTDFVIVILGWWLEAMSKIITAKGYASTKLMFMDGPIYIRVMKLGEDIIEVEFVENGEVINRLEFSINQFMNLLLMATENVITEIDNRNWNTRDIDSLKRAFIQANNVINKS